MKLGTTTPLGSIAGYADGRGSCIALGGEWIVPASGCCVPLGTHIVSNVLPRISA